MVRPAATESEGFIHSCRADNTLSHSLNRLKETNDYFGCLSVATSRTTLSKYNLSATHALVLEDDSAAVPGSLARINDLLIRKVKYIVHLEGLDFSVQYYLQSSSLQLFWRSDWLFVKLFYPDIYKGFERTLASILELLSISFTVSMILVGVHQQ